MSSKSNVAKLVQQDAFNDIVGKFPELTNKIVGISFVADIGDQVKMFSCKLSIGHNLLSIPIIVFNKNEIDATTFLMNEESNTLLALSAPLLKEITRENGLLSGKSSVAKALDGGNISALFRAPMTFGARYASDNSMPSIVELARESDEIRLKLLKKAVIDPRYKRILDRVCGPELLKSASDTYQKIINGMNPKIIESKDDLKKSASVHDKSYREFMMNGFHVDLNNDMQDLDVRPCHILSDAVETVTINRPGVYLMYDKDTGKEVELVVSEDIASPLVMGQMFKKHISHYDRDESYVGKRRQETKCAKSSLFTEEIVSLAMHNPRDTAIFFVRQDGVKVSKIYRIPISDIRISNGDINFVNSKGVSVKISKDDNVVPHVSDKSIIVPKSRVSYTIRKTNTHLLPPRLNFIPKTIDDTRTTPVNRIKITHDMGDFFLDGARHGKISLLKELIQRGFKTGAVKILIKTAEDKSRVDMEVVSGLKSVGDAVIQLSKSIEDISNRVDNIEASVSQEDVYTQQDMIDANESMHPAPLQEDYSDSQILPMDDYQSQVEAQAQAQAQPMQPNGYSQEEQEMLQQQAGQAPVQEQQQMQDPNADPVPPTLSNGMNLSMDATVLERIEALKDTAVMDSAILSTIADEEMASVIDKYSDEVLMGTSAVGKILLNTLSRRYDIDERRGEANRKKLELTLRALFLKMTNLHIDITKSKRSY